VGEARLAYRVEAPTDLWSGATTTLSSKNQITLPAAMCRALDIRPGDKLDLWVNGRSIIVERMPRTPEEWIETTAGAMSHVPEWESDEKIDAWVRGIRSEWDEREWQDEPSSS
jgi:AbrB family looped-hinge helix DNA binding protein